MDWRQVKRAVFARHCNPWSAWTRWASTPLILIPIWRRSWRDAALVGAWMAINPVVFGKPAHEQAWSTRAILGPEWSLHTKITLLTYGALAAPGIVAVTAIEWSNPNTLGRLDLPARLLAGVFQGITPRTAGFNVVDVGAMHPSSLLVTDVLMFIGGGSAGTAGGIMVTTFAVLAFVIIAEIRGETSVHVMGRRLAAPVQRQAITVALLGVGAVMSGTHRWLEQASDTAPA
jgi:Trk-type K+ transport system membrane component